MPVPGVRKSGMPEAVDIPAPVNTKIRLYLPDVICCTNVSRLNVSRLLDSLLPLLLLSDRLTPDFIEAELPPPPLAELFVLNDLFFKIIKNFKPLLAFCVQFEKRNRPV